MATAIERGRFGSYSVHDEALSRGGVGSIHRTGDPAFVVKRYFAPHKAPSLGHLNRLIEVGRDVLVQQGKRPGDTPESSVNWPVDIITGTGGAVRAVVLPIIPKALFNDEYETVRTLDFLVMARAKPPAVKGRLALLIRMAEILAFVHSRQLVHGDVNGKNLAWDLRTHPIMYLIDCDGMVPQSPPPAAGVGAPGWMDPRFLEKLIPAHDHYSDWYALALAMYRGLLLTPGRLDSKRSDGTWPEPTKIPPELAPAVADLMRRGLSDPLHPEHRPSPREWVDALLAAYVPHGRYDEDALDRLDRVTAPKPAPKPFVPLPTVDWGSSSTAVPPTGHTPPQPVPGPVRAGPVPQYAPPPSYGGPPYGGPPRPYGANPYAPPGYVQHSRVGSLGQQALHPEVRWYVLGLLACLILPFVAMIYIGISFYQLRELSNDERRVLRARITLGVYAALCLPFLPTFFSWIV